MLTALRTIVAVAGFAALVGVIAIGGVWAGACGVAIGVLSHIGADLKHGF